MNNTASDVNGVVITGDLDRRPSRAPDFQAENQALTALAEAMGSSPGTVLQRLVEAAMELTRSDSAGISLLEPGGENGAFRWVATAGAWSAYRGGTMPRDASPCGEVIAQETVLLVKNPERSFPALLQAEPGISEGLLAPFYLGGVPLGTVWTIKHSPNDHFDAEDARILKSLARFASAAQQAVQAIQLAEAAGQQAEIRVRQLVALADISTEFIGTCDMNLMPIYGNPAALRTVGLVDLEQAKRTPLQAFFFPEDLPFITDEFFPRVLREGQAKVEIRFRHFVTGEPVWVDYSLVLLKDEMGRASGLGTVTHDLTERKRAEAMLRDSEARFRALATVGSSSVYRMSPDWREMRGLDGAAFLAHTDAATTDWVDTYIPPDERPRVRDTINQAIAAKGVFELEHRVLRADGTVGWTFSRAIPLLDDAGEISEWFGAATDVTARVKADQSFTRLFQASPAPFLVLKPDAPEFTIAEVNDAYLSATMRTRGEVVGRGIFAAYPGNPSDETIGGVRALRASLERVLASGQPDTLPYLHYDVARPDGTFEERWWSPVNSAVLDDDGEIEAIIHNANDVTEARRAQIALRESEGRHAFLLKLSDTLRPLRDPFEVQTATMRLVVEHLDVMRASYFTIDPDQEGFSLTAGYERGALPIPDHMRVSDFALDMADGYRKGRTFVVKDAETEAPTELVRASYRAIGVRAAVGVPLVKDELLIGVFGVHSATPRHWSDAEVQLLEDVADRIWAAVDRAHAEVTLRESEERQAFLLKLSDALRPLAEPLAVQVEAMRVLGQHLAVSRAQYHELEPDNEWITPGGGYADSVPLHADRSRMDDFGAFVRDAYEGGRTLVVSDTELDARISTAERAAFAGIGVRAFVAVPLVKNGRFVGVLGLDHTTARSWSQNEIALTEDVAERTWAAVERARAEARLRDSEARFRQFSDASTNILWIRDAATMRMEFASPAFDTVYGFAGPDRGGDDRLESWARLIVPEDRQRVLANFRRVRAEQRVEQEFRVRRGSDGEVRWIRDVEFPLLDEQGHVRGVAGVGQDITAQKRAEETLREREERLGLILENARDYAIFTIDGSGMVTDWRGGAEAVFGWSRAEAIGMDARDIFTPEDRDAGQLEREIEGARAKGRAPDVRWHLRKDRSRVLIDGALTRLGDGPTRGFLKMGQDVTERHRAEAALMASEGRLQTLMEGIPQLVWRSCEKGLWTWASPQWLQFTGQSPEQSRSMGWLDVIHPDDHAAATLAWADARPHGLLDIEYRVRRAANGDWMWHHTRSVPVRNEGGRIVEWLGTSTDVQVLKEFQERQGVLVAELQHRTRNLIALVRSTSEKTARGSADLTDFRARFRDRLDALARVQGLLSRLNDLERVTFDDLIKAELAAMDSDPDKVTLEGPPGIRLRSSTVQTLAMGLHELATNAVKYGALRQPHARLAVSWRWESLGEGGKPWLHIDWRETGVTMAPAGTDARGAGQGRELIERALPYQLSAKTSYELGRDGVHCTISLPVSATADLEDDHD